MAVEFRCPDCRAKLRVATAPEPGEEVECPKCGIVFPAPDLGAEPPKASKKPPAEPKKRKPIEDDEEDEKPVPKKAAGGGEKPKTAADGSPKKRKSKKKETNQNQLIAVIAGAVVVVICIAGLLIWFLNRTPASYEMMTYLPDDTYIAFGCNSGHIQKYPEFYKNVGALIEQTDVKAAVDKMKDINLDEKDIDYVVWGRSKSTSGSVFVLRLKKGKVVSSDILAKLPGAKAQTLDGRTYYTGSEIGAQIFTPSDRLIVVSSDILPTPQLQKMLKGNIGSETMVSRAGPLAKRTLRGTFWRLELWSGGIKNRETTLFTAEGNLRANDPANFTPVYSEATSSAAGMGIRANVGSHEVKCEIILATGNSDSAKDLSRKWQESDLAKGDEGSPPGWFVTFQNTAGDKKIGRDLLSNMGFTSSGELFIIRSAIDTKNLMTNPGPLINKMVVLKQAAPPPPK